MSFNRFRHPEGTQLPALERNILKYRGFEMLLLLFYVEELRGMVIGTIRATDHWKNGRKPRLESSTKNKFKRATSALVADGMLSKVESKEIGDLVNTRNIIAHELHKMTFDVSRDTWARTVHKLESPSYNYESLDRIKYFHDELERRMRSKYAREISLDSLLFRSAERTYTRELKSLKRRIDAQYLIRRRKLAGLKQELSLKGT